MILAACNNSNVLSTISFIKTIIDIMIYIVPSILLVFLGFKLFKIVTSSDPNLSKGVDEIVGKMIACVIVFFIPSLVGLLTSFLSSSGIGVAKDYSYCIDNATKENIAFYKEKEEAAELLEQEKAKVEKEKADKEKKAVDKTREKARKANEKRAEEIRKQVEKDKKEDQSKNWDGKLVDGDAKTWKDVVWDPNDVTKISNLTSAQLKEVLRAKGGNAVNFIPLADAYITNEHTNQINALFFISLHAIESAWVTSPVSASCNNLGGWKDFGNPSYVCSRAPSNEGSTPYMYFPSKEDFILNVGSSMHRNYLTPGGSHYHGPSIEGIIQDYNCGSESEIQSIKSIANDFFTYVKKVV